MQWYSEILQNTHLLIRFQWKSIEIIQMEDVVFWHSPTIQHEVKLADGERNSMVLLLLDSSVAVFPHFSVLISLYPPVPELLLVEQSSHHASAVFWTKRLESEECVGLDSPSPQRPYKWLLFDLVGFQHRVVNSCRLLGFIYLIVCGPLFQAGFQTFFTRN